MRLPSLPSRGVLLVLLLAGVLACRTNPNTPESRSASEEPPLARYMMNLQHWSHKAALSVEARNAKLADFYLHELEETIETIQEEAPTYDGHAVGTLTKEMLVPSVEALSRSVDKKAWPTVDKRVQALARSCNQCHKATGYGFIRVDLTDVPNPYAQTFDTSARP